jgi:hypothetical protein
LKKSHLRLKYLLLHPISKCPTWTRMTKKKKNPKEGSEIGEEEDEELVTKRGT